MNEQVDDIIELETATLLDSENVTNDWLGRQKTIEELTSRNNLRKTCCFWIAIIAYVVGWFALLIAMCENQTSPPSQKYVILITLTGIFAIPIFMAAVGMFGLGLWGFCLGELCADIWKLIQDVL